MNSTMYQITDIFEPQHAQKAMEKSENESSQFWKPWEEEDEAIIAKSFTPVWEFSPLFSITDEILKRYVKCWSRGERIQLLEYVASKDKIYQDQKFKERKEALEVIQRR